MNLDEFKSLTRGVSAPAGAPSSNTNLDSFITEMRTRDQQERRRLMGLALIYFSVALVFTGAALGRPPGSRLIGVGFVLVALFAGLKGRWFGRVNYAAPAREFLATAARRYQFWRATDLLYVIPLFLIMVVGGADSLADGAEILQPTAHSTGARRVCGICRGRERVRLHPGPETMATEKRRLARRNP